MKERDEMELHRKMKMIEGQYEAKTDWGKIAITLNAVPNYAGGKGCPDEILSVKVKFAILGTDVELVAPVLIEMEKAGYSDAVADLNKFCERSISGEQKGYLQIPMIVVGGAKYKKQRSLQRQLAARFSPVQVPKRMVE